LYHLIIGNKTSYNDFKKNLNYDIQILLDLLREFCVSVGSNVVEDVRMHRVVYCKSFKFRWFVDMEPNSDYLLVKIQQGRNLSPNTMKITPKQNLDEVKKLISNAYNQIH